MPQSSIPFLQLLVFWGFLLLIAGLAPAQPPAPDHRPPPPETLIQPGDLVEVNISELVFTDGDYAEARRVSPSGHVRLPVIGRIQVDGQTEAQARRTLEKHLRVTGISPRPQVRVVLRAQAAQLREPAGPLAPGDRVVVRVFGLDDRNTDFGALLRLDADGHLNLPRVGVVAAGGLDTHQLEERLLDTLFTRGVSSHFRTEDLEPYEQDFVTGQGVSRSDIWVRVEREEDRHHAKFATSWTGRVSPGPAPARN